MNQLTRHAPMDKGPYCNEDGDWWVPVEGIRFYQARALVVGCLPYSVPEDGRLAYVGKVTQWLDSEHEGYCGEECETNLRVLAWHFEERWDG